MTKRPRNSNGQPTVRPDPNRGGFVMSVSLPKNPITGKRRRTTVRGATRSEVIGKFNELMDGLQRNIVSSRGDMTFEQWADIWLRVSEIKGRALTTLTGYEHHLRSHMVPQLGRIRLKDITPELIDLAVSRLSRLRGPNAGQPASSSTRRRHPVLWWARQGGLSD